MNAAQAFVAEAGVADRDVVKLVAVKAVPRLLLGPKPAPGETADPDETAAPDETGAPDETAAPGESGAAADPNAQAVRGGDAYIIDNVARCSVGFSVEGGFVSAGHCGQEGSTTTAEVGGEQVAQGEFQASSFPTDDFSFIAVNDT
ncbi:hypothetical protein DDE19_00085, partial [Micromonospora ureilytica]